MEFCSLKTAILRTASSSLASRDSSAGISAWSMRGSSSGRNADEGYGDAVGLAQVVMAFAEALLVVDGR